MLRIIYACNPNDPMSTVVENRIKNELLEGLVYSYVDIKKFPFSIDDLQLTFNQTLIIKDHKNGEELSRLEGPFTTEQVKEIIFDAKQFLKGEFIL